jgi:hypothetical protein
MQRFLAALSCPVPGGFSSLCVAPLKYALVGGGGGGIIMGSTTVSHNCLRNLCNLVVVFCADLPYRSGVLYFSRHYASILIVSLLFFVIVSLLAELGVSR